MQEMTYLGVRLIHDGTWHKHIDQVIARMHQRTCALTPLLQDSVFHTKNKIRICKSTIRPLVEFAVRVWHATQLSRQN